MTESSGFTVSVQYCRFVLEKKQQNSQTRRQFLRSGGLNESGFWGGTDISQHDAHKAIKKRVIVSNCTLTI